ncbi:MAG TPA: hypothetical protein VE080_00140 [Candidatus Aquicultoraceae bacterium]|jgi:hypothetical protein|nr:hypothetical protein [Candidatus Aquicultoraceae bacterium]
MTRKVLLLALLLGLLAPSCREERPDVALTPDQEALLEEKADAKIGLIIRKNLPALFAGLVVFRSDVFLTQSEMLERRDLPVLDSFDNAAVVLLNSPDIPPLLAEKSVRKMYYLCRQGTLARIHPAFLMEILKRFGEGKEAGPIPFLVRFREPPQEKESRFVQEAGFSVVSRDGLVWSLSGPPASIPRLLEDDRIIFYEGASKARTM